MNPTFDLPRRDADRLHRSYEPTPKSDCWMWVGYLNDAGYGIFYWGTGSDKRQARAHRVSYEMFVDAIPEGLVLDHLCRNRACVNPWHLDPVTDRVNIARGRGRFSAATAAARQTHCKNGHAYDAENTFTDRGGKRSCRQCMKERQQVDVRCPKCGAVRAYRTILTHAQKGCPDPTNRRSTRYTKRDPSRYVSDWTEVQP